MLNLHYLKSTQSPLDGHYRLIERIGGGGFSDVWLAHDLRSRVDVVLKVYASSQELDEEGVEMFRKEFSLVCNLSHTNILKPFTFDIFQGSPYIVLPYCEKGSASKLAGKITEEELWDFAGQVAAGLSYLHGHGIIHQDIKPANILIKPANVLIKPATVPINADCQYMITDFGISTGLRNTIRKSVGKEDGGFGTTAYMSYECLGPKPTNVIARDIWAFGATLYELASGDVPFGEFGGITQKSMGGEVPKIENGFSDELKGLIYRCLAFNAWDRPGADEIVETVGNHKKGIKPPVPFPWKKTVVGISAAAVIAAICLSAVLHGKPEPPVIVNPNDSIFLARVEEANEIVRVEKAKGNVDSVDEAKLCTAVQIYKDAMNLEVTDTVMDKGKSLWSMSQELIDETYIYLYRAGAKFDNANAPQAADLFKKRSRTLAEHVSDSAKAVIGNIGISVRVTAPSTPSELTPTNVDEMSSIKNKY